MEQNNANSMACQTSRERYEAVRTKLEQMTEEERQKEFSEIMFTTRNDIAGAREIPSGELAYNCLERAIMLMPFFDLITEAKDEFWNAIDAGVYAGDSVYLG